MISQDNSLALCSPFSCQVLSPESQVSSLSSPLEYRETRTRVAEGDLATCSQGLGPTTGRPAQQEQQEQKVRVLTALTNEVLAYKGRLEDKEQELARLRQEVQERQGVKEESEALHRETRLEKNQLIDQMNHVSLTRDALEDEVRHLREEVARLRGQEEVAQLHVANITQGLEELVARLATREREVTDLRLRAEYLEGEVEKLEGVAEDLKLKAEGEEGRARELQEALALRQGELEGLDDQVLSLKSGLAEVSRKMSEQQKQADELRVAEERKTEKKVEKLRDDNARMAREQKEELSELKEKLERKRTEDINKLSIGFQLEKERLEEERDFLQGEVANLRARGSESLWLSENSCSTGETLARSQGSLAEARIQELSLLTDNKMRKRLEATGELENLLEENSGPRSMMTELDLELDLELQVLRRQENTHCKGQELRRWLQEDDLQVVRLQEVKGVRKEAEQEVEAREGQVQELYAPARSSSSGVLVVKGEEATLVISRQDQSQVSPSTSPSTARVSQARATTPASSTASLQPSLKRPVDLEADSDYQKKARTNISTESRHLQVSSSLTRQSGSSPKKESDMSMAVEGGEERRQVDSNNQYSGDLDVEEETLSGEQEENSSEVVATRTEEGGEVGSSHLQTLVHVCDGCQSVFTQAASLHHHQAVSGRCRRVKEPEPQEFVCHRCFKQFNSKSHWSKHVSFVLDCSDKKQQRKDKVTEEMGLLEVQVHVEELCLGAVPEVDSSLEVLPARSPLSLPGLEETASPVGDHCYALSGNLAPEPSSHNPSRPVQVNSGL